MQANLIHDAIHDKGGAGHIAGILQESNKEKKNEEENKSYVQEAGVKGALEAELSYRLVGKSERFFLLEVVPKTGRHHQIRVQLSTIGSPIKGDVKYGYERTNEHGGIHLHAIKVEFIHPVNKTKTEIIAPLPNDVIWNYFKKEKAENLSVASDLILKTNTSE